MPEDSFDGQRDMIALVAEAAHEYCGLPMPIPGEKLIIEPSHPARARYGEIDAKHLPADAKPGATLVNQWYNCQKGCDIVLWREADGTRHWGIVPAIHHIGMDVRTMGCHVAWSLESEVEAMRTLKDLIKPHLFKMYCLSGMFLETSHRSGVTYIFRRLRPTVAIKANAKGDDMHILCCLCLHPIGYYAGTWAGSMCPTDDVLGHLMLMRGDEKLYWRRANQIAPYRREAGL